MELTGIRFLPDLELEGRRVLCRVDFNVPLDGAEIVDDSRIRAALPTIAYLREKQAHVALASHLGRPEGREMALSLEPCAKRLAELLDDEVRLPDDCIGDGVRRVIKDLPAGGVAVLENLRFHEAEAAGDLHFAKLLASPFQAYVNDAFGTCHRSHASLYGVTQYLSDRAAGFLLQREIEALGQLLVKPKRPFVALLGGAKVAGKIGVIRSLLSRCDTLLVGGAMAYTLLRAKGVHVGNSIVEHESLALAQELLREGTSGRRARIMLPSDHVVAVSIDAGEGVVRAAQDIPDGLAGFDIGPATRARFSEVVSSAGTVFWNGPLGVYENDAFAAGTLTLARAIAQSRAVSVIGGGDSAAAVLQAGVADRITHVSTGGGASLQFVEGKPLPGLEALRVGHWR